MRRLILGGAYTLTLTGAGSSQHLSIASRTSFSINNGLLSLGSTGDAPGDTLAGSATLVNARVELNDAAFDMSGESVERRNGSQSSIMLDNVPKWILPRIGTMTSPVMSLELENSLPI